MSNAKRSPRLALQLRSMETASRHRLYMNDHLQLVTADRVGVPKTTLGQSLQPGFINPAHVEDTSTVWILAVENPDGSHVGNIVVEVNHDDIVAIHNSYPVSGNISDMEPAISCILASNADPVKIIGVSSKDADFWESLGAAPLDPYRNSTIHWSDYERQTYTRDNESNRSVLGGRTGEILSRLQQESDGLVQHQPTGNHGAARTRPENALKSDELAFLNAYNNSDKEKTFFQFAGFKARTANLLALDAARQFNADGHAPEDIRKKTGWFIGEDKQWRFEISDHNATINLSELTTSPEGFRFIGPLPDILNHPALFAAYPQLNRLQVSLDVMAGYELTGNFNPSANGHQTHLDIIADNIEDALDGILHELQHAIQKEEGFAMGGNSVLMETYFHKAAKERFDALRNRQSTLHQQASLSPLATHELSLIESELTCLQNATSAINKGYMAPMFYERYLSLAGEREATLTAVRREFNPGQRFHITPTLPVGELDPIVVYNGVTARELTSAMNLPSTAYANISLFPTKSIIRLTESADQSAFFHELAHLALDMEARLAKNKTPTPFQQKILDWLNVPSFEAIGVKEHEKFAQGFEQYLHQGIAPTPAMKSVFDTVKGWFSKIYHDLTALGEPINEVATSIFNDMLTPSISDPANVEQAQHAQLKIRNQLISTGLYNMTEANTTAAIVGTYALATAEREPNLATVERVLEQMNINIEVVEHIEMNTDHHFDFESFSIHTLVDQERFHAQEKLHLLQSMDLNIVSDTLDLGYDNDFQQSMQVH